jgi:Ca2+-binding RTX toxin-like protein
MPARIFFSDSTGVLYSVNPLDSNLDATRIGFMPAIMTDLALSQSGRLYGITFNGIYRIDPADGSADLVAGHNLPGANALYIAPNNVAYAASFLAGGVYKINLTTGTSTRLALSETQYKSAGDITMLNGELVMATVDNKLVRIDADTGATLGEVTHGIANLYGITTVGDDLYGVANGSLYKLNAYTGTTSVVSSYEINSIFGAAVSDFGQSGIVRNGTSGSETLGGSSRDDVMFGNAGNDTLNGGTGNDQMFGGSGNDKITGGKGLDKIYGGTGSDQFIFAAFSDSSASASRADVIYDFRDGDKVILSALDANLLRSGNNTFRIDVDGDVRAGEVDLTYASGRTRAEFNIDGDAAFEMTLVFRGAKLDAGDFVL